VRVALAGFEASGAAALWVAEKGGAMARLADVPIAGGALAFELPATSIAMLVVEGRGPEEQANRAADAGAAPSTPVDAGAPVAGSAPAAPPGPRRACGFAPEPPGPSPWGAIALGAALASAARRRGRAPVVDARHAGLG
jgi:MYXO-CTERM domain-containing protein